MPTIDLSADIGESLGSWRMGDDAALVPLLSSANLACGFHAGDPATMERAVGLCVEHGVAVGAHPGFRDLHGFGRRSVEMSRDEVRLEVLYQLGALQAFAVAAGTRIAHVSPHGRLGNLTVTDEVYAAGVVDAVEAFDRAVRVVGQAGLVHRLAAERGLPTGALGFPDRAYDDDGSLVPRAEPDAVLHDVDEIAARAVRLATDRTITTRSGRTIEVPCDTILLHGDNAEAVESARRVRHALDQAGIEVRAR